MAKVAANDSSFAGVAEGEARPLPQGWRLANVLFALALALALALASLGMTAPGIALPQILSDPHDLNSLTSVITSYLLVETAAIPIASFFSQRIGYRRGLVAGMLIFMAGSVLAGAAPTIAWLILFRGLQGLGAGCFIGLAFMLCRSLFTPAVRVRWQAVFAGLYALFAGGGPTIGLWLLGFASWRWLFWINLPLMSVALALLVCSLPTDQRMHSWKPIA